MAAEVNLAERVRAALAASRGNRREAQKLLLAWAAEDGRLMRALVLPYLPGIVGRAIDAERAPEVKPKAAPVPGARPAGQAPQAGRRKPLTEDVLDRLADRLGAHFDETPGTAADGAARQASSLRTIAVAHARRRYDPDRPDDD